MIAPQLLIAAIYYRRARLELHTRGTNKKRIFYERHSVQSIAWTRHISLVNHIQGDMVRVRTMERASAAQQKREGKLKHGSHNIQRLLFRSVSSLSPFSANCLKIIVPLALYTLYDELGLYF